MALATREAFLNNPKVKEVRYKTVTIPILGEVRIRSLNDREYSAIQARNMKANGKLDRAMAQRNGANLIVATVVDEEGVPFMTEADVEAVRSMDSSITEALVREIQDHVSVESREEIKND